MKCPVCKIETDKKECPNCKIVLDDGIEMKSQSKHMKEEITYSEPQRTNADCLNFMANLNIVLTVIGAIYALIKFSFIEVSNGKYVTQTEFSWFGIIGALAILISGFTIFFLLKTVADTYWRVEK